MSTAVEVYAGGLNPSPCAGNWLADQLWAEGQ